MTTLSATTSRRGRANAGLWTVQGLLAALFLFAGGMKLAMPAALLAQQAHLPGGFMKFIGVCEVLGALGLVLPGLTKIRQELTPLAALGLLIIMVGATTVTLLQGLGAAAIVPAAVGGLAAVVARGRGRRNTGFASDQGRVYAKAA